MNYDKYIDPDIIEKFEYYNYGHALEILHESFPEVLRGKLRAAETAAYFRRYSLPDCACGHQTAHNHYDERRASVTC